MASIGYVYENIYGDILYVINKHLFNNNYSLFMCAAE